MDLMAKLKSMLDPQTPAPAKQGNPADGQVNAAKAAIDASGGKTPEMKYEEIWKQEAAPIVNQGPVFSTDQAKFAEAVSGMDFTKNLPQDVMQKALSGDANAFMALLNRVGQNAFSSATISSRDMVEHATKKTGGSLEQQVREAVRVALSEANLTKANTAFNDPLVQPLLKEVNGRLRSKFPEASPEELATKSQQMLMQIATRIVSGSPEEVARQKQETDTKDRVTKGQDWEQWATTGIQTSNDGADFLNSMIGGGDGGTMQ